MMKVCLKCGKKISVNENYYSFTEYNKQKVINIDYAHRKCWDDFIHSLDDAGSVLKTAKSMLSGLQSSLTDKGILPPTEVIIN